jgi:hypothetical protein
LLFPRAFIITHPDPSVFPFGEELLKKERKREPRREKKIRSLFLSISLSLSLLQNACRRKPNRGEGRKKEGIVVVFILLIEFIHTREHTHTHTHTQHINININNNISLRGIRKRNTLKSRSAAALLSPSIEVDKKVKEE